VESASVYAPVPTPLLATSSEYVTVYDPSTLAAGFTPDASDFVTLISGSGTGRQSLADSVVAPSFIDAVLRNPVLVAPVDVSQSAAAAVATPVPLAVTRTTKECVARPSIAVAPTIDVAVVPFHVAVGVIVPGMAFVTVGAPTTETPAPKCNESVRVYCAGPSPLFTTFTV
jgi:hypothetical protein